MMPGLKKLVTAVLETKLKIYVSSCVICMYNQVNVQLLFWIYHPNVRTVISLHKYVFYSYVYTIPEVILTMWKYIVMD